MNFRGMTSLPVYILNNLKFTWLILWHFLNSKIIFGGHGWHLPQYYQTEESVSENILTAIMQNALLFNSFLCLLQMRLQLHILWLWQIKALLRCDLISFLAALPQNSSGCDNRCIQKSIWQLLWGFAWRSSLPVLMKKTWYQERRRERR